MKAKEYCVIVTWKGEERSCLFETKELANFFIEICKEKGFKAEQDAYPWEIQFNYQSGNKPLEELN